MIQDFNAYLASLGLADLHTRANRLGYRVRSASALLIDLEYQAGDARFLVPGKRLVTVSDEAEAQAFLNGVEKELKSGEERDTDGYTIHGDRR
jgi:hypothetical protein